MNIMAETVTNEKEREEAARWDRFLETCPRGQFQQTARWARVKAHDGWQVRRVSLEAERPEGGGFQLLWKATRWGRLGYVSKGPVPAVEDANAVAGTLERLGTVARELGLRAVIVQPPDESAMRPAELCVHGFCARPIRGVIRATAVLDLRGGREAIARGLHRQMKRHLRAAQDRHVTLRLGGRAELKIFFELMRESCRRQGVRPNPGRLELLESLWDEFSPRVGLGLASCDGRDVAGLLSIGHGERLTLWKKGWCADDLASGANSLLHVETLGWAADHGYAWADFAGMDHGIAERLIAGADPTEGQRRSRDVFNLSLGALPRLLPPGQVLIPSRALRTVYRFVSGIPWLGRWGTGRALGG